MNTDQPLNENIVGRRNMGCLRSDLVSAKEGEEGRPSKGGPVQNGEEEEDDAPRDKHLRQLDGPWVLTVVYLVHCYRGCSCTGTHKRSLSTLAKKFQRSGQAAGKIPAFYDRISICPCAEISLVERSEAQAESCHFSIVSVPRQPIS